MKKPKTLLLIAYAIILLYALITNKENIDLRRENETLQKELYLVNDANCIL